MKLGLTFIAAGAGTGVASSVISCGLFSKRKQPETKELQTTLENLSQKISPA